MFIVLVLSWYGIDSYTSILFVVPLVFALGALCERFLIFSADYQTINAARFQTGSWTVGGISLSKPRLFAFITMLLTSGVLLWFLKTSDFGRAIRATAQGPAAFSQACIGQRLEPGAVQSVARTGKRDKMIARLHSHVSVLSDFRPRRFSSGIVMFGKTH